MLISTTMPDLKKDSTEWIKLEFSDTDLEISFGGDDLLEAPLFSLNREQILELYKTFCVAKFYHEQN